MPSALLSMQKSSVKWFIRIVMPLLLLALFFVTQAYVRFPNRLSHGLDALVCALLVALPAAMAYLFCAQFPLHPQARAVISAAMPLLWSLLMAGMGVYEVLANMDANHANALGGLQYAIQPIAYGICAMIITGFALHLIGRSSKRQSA